MWTIEFWKAAAERAVKTLAQSLIASITVAGVAAGLGGINWATALSTAALATVLSVLTSIASSAVGSSGPSLTTETIASAADVDTTRGRHER